MGDALTPISKRELLEYQADVQGAIFRQIRQIFARLKKEGFTQKDLAMKIGMDEGQLSRRLRGDYDLRLETLSDLARGLDCRIDVKLAPLSKTTTSTVSQSVRPVSYSEMRPGEKLKGQPFKELEDSIISSSQLSSVKQRTYVKERRSPSKRRELTRDVCLKARCRYAELRMKGPEKEPKPNEFRGKKIGGRR
jgi:transcriptional regulator with XRE-family HTH domain